MGENTEAKKSLLHILMIYSVRYNKTVGYCQGIITQLLVYLTTLYHLALLTVVCIYMQVWLMWQLYC